MLSICFVCFLENVFAVYETIELSDPLINESILIQDLPFLNLQFIKNDYQSLNETSIQCMDFRIISTRVFNLSINIYFKTNRNTHTNINKIVDKTIVSDVIIPPWNIRITENSLRPLPQPRQTKLSLGPPPPLWKIYGKTRLYIAKFYMRHYSDLFWFMIKKWYVLNIIFS